MCPKIVDGDSKYLLPVKYICYYNSSFVLVEFHTHRNTHKVEVGLATPTFWDVSRFKTMVIICFIYVIAFMMCSLNNDMILYFSYVQNDEWGKDLLFVALVIGFCPVFNMFFGVVCLCIVCYCCVVKLDWLMSPFIT